MFSYTLHALDKFETKEAKKFKIDKKLVEKAIKNGLVVELEEDVTTIVGDLDREHSLCIVFKKQGKSLKIITFFPAKKGRYERKIL